jgi:hypothetical protein
MKGIADILKENGYKVVEGGKEVINAIGFNFSKDSRCSGYRVFPDGKKCPGCGDCQSGESQ